MSGKKLKPARKRELVEWVRGLTGQVSLERVRWISRTLKRLLPAERFARIAHHGKPRSITVDHGTEFMSRALDEWAYRRGVALDFIRPGKPAENGFIESFNGKLRHECLNANQFLSIDDAKCKIEAGEPTTTCIGHTAQ